MAAKVIEKMRAAGSALSSINHGIKFLKCLIKGYEAFIQEYSKEFETTV